MTKKLSFSYNPAPHMFLATGKESQWNGELIATQNFSLPPGAASLNYGPSIFEGLKARRLADGSIAVFRPDKNAERMIAGAKRLGMQSVPEELFLQAIQEVGEKNINEIPASGEGDLYIRPMLFASEGVLGLQTGNEFTFCVWAAAVGPYFKNGMTPGKFIIETRSHRAVVGGTGDVKYAGNYGAVLQYSTEAKANGFNEVIWTDAKTKQYVEEAGAANLFLVKNGELYTPELSGTILPGVTRDSVIQLAKHLEIPVHEEKVPIESLLNADEAFCTGTAAGLSPIGAVSYRDELHELNNQKLGELTQKLYTALTDIQYGRSEDVFGWNVQV